MTPSPFPRILAAILIGALPLAGCASVPPLGDAPKVRAASSFAAGQTLASATPSQGWPQSEWWHAYGDPQLDSLIGEGLGNAPDVAVAVARLRAAEGYRQQATGALLPALNAQGSVGGAKQSYNYGIPAAFVPQGVQDTGSAALGLNFDIDLWGKNRAALRASNADELAARLDVAQARLLLSTNIANAYATLAQLYAERDVQAAAIQLRSQTQALVASRYATGLDTRAEVKQADAAVPAARAELAAIDEAIALTNQIQAYQGQGHSCGIYSTSDANILKLAYGTRTSRVMVNQPQAPSNSGNLWNGMRQTFSLGCGSWGGNGTNNNITWRDLINETWVSKPLAVAKTLPSDEELFGKDVMEALA